MLYERWQAHLYGWIEHQIEELVAVLQTQHCADAEEAQLEARIMLSLRLYDAGLFDFYDLAASIVHTRALRVNEEDQNA